MRYFDEQLIANSRLHRTWWDELTANRAHFRDTEIALNAYHNSTAILPDEAWREVDQITRQVMRHDEGQAYMADLMPLAKPIDIGKLVHMTRVSSDAGSVSVSMSGQTPVELDKVTYDHRGTPIPIFRGGYGRNWREWNTMQSENFDAIADDQEATTAEIRQNMALYALNGDDSVVASGFQGYGLRNHPLSKSINLGSGAGGANIDLANATTDAIEAFFDGVVQAMLDDNFIKQGVNVYVSPQIMRRLNQPYSASTGFKGGTLKQQLEEKAYINKIEKTFELTGNEFFGFVPSASYVRPLIGMAVNTTAMTRLNPTDAYQFLVMGAMGIEIRGDFNNRSGVFSSVVVN